MQTNTNTDLLAFLKLFGAGDAAPKLAQRLQLVLTNPAEYATEFAEELTERGIEAAIPTQELRDLALLDALLSEDLAVECDWQETAGDMLSSLNYVLIRQGKPLLAEAPDLGTNDEIGPEQLDLVHDTLEPLGLALVQFSLDGDSYPLGIVALEQTEELATQARQLGFKLHTW